MRSFRRSLFIVFAVVASISSFGLPSSGSGRLTVSQRTPRFVSVPIVGPAVEDRTTKRVFVSSFISGEVYAFDYLGNAQGVVSGLADPGALAVGNGYVYVHESGANRVTRINPLTLQRSTVAIGLVEVSDLAFANGSLFVMDTEGLKRVNPTTGAVTMQVAGFGARQIHSDPRSPNLIVGVSWQGGNRGILNQEFVRHVFTLLDVSTGETAEFTADNDGSFFAATVGILEQSRVLVSTEGMLGTVELRLQANPYTGRRWPRGLVALNSSFVVAGGFFVSSSDPGDLLAGSPLSEGGPPATVLLTSDSSTLIAFDPEQIGFYGGLDGSAPQAPSATTGRTAAPQAGAPGGTSPRSAAPQVAPAFRSIADIEFDPNQQLMYVSDPRSGLVNVYLPDGTFRLTFPHLPGVSFLSFHNGEMLAWVNDLGSIVRLNGATGRVEQRCSSLGLDYHPSPISGLVSVAGELWTVARELLTVERIDLATCSVSYGSDYSNGYLSDDASGNGFFVEQYLWGGPRRFVPSVGFTTSGAINGPIVPVPASLKAIAGLGQRLDAETLLPDGMVYPGVLHAASGTNGVVASQVEGTNSTIVIRRYSTGEEIRRVPFADFLYRMEFQPNSSVLWVVTGEFGVVNLTRIGNVEISGQSTAPPEQGLTATTATESTITQPVEGVGSQVETTVVERNPSQVKVEDNAPETPTATIAASPPSSVKPSASPHARARVCRKHRRAKKRCVAQREPVNQTSLNR
jgi:hypothetical protein